MNKILFTFAFALLVSFSTITYASQDIPDSSVPYSTSVPNFPLNAFQFQSGYGAHFIWFTRNALSSDQVNSGNIGYVFQESDNGGSTWTTLDQPINTGTNLPWTSSLKYISPLAGGGAGVATSYLIGKEFRIYTFFYTSPGVIDRTECNAEEGMFGDDAQSCQWRDGNMLGYGPPDPCCPSINKTYIGKTTYFAEDGTLPLIAGDCVPAMYPEDTNRTCVNYSFTTNMTPTATITPIVGSKSGTITIDVTTNYGGTNAGMITVDTGSAVSLTTNGVTGTYVLDTTGLSDGSHTVSVTDTYSGQTIHSDSVAFTVSNAAPPSPPSDSGSGSTGTVSTTSVGPVLPADMSDINTFFSGIGTPKNSDQSDKITEYENFMKDATNQTKFNKCKGICNFTIN